ncbi:avidin/streptavidin family protein [Duganella radicis]|uniref:Peptidase A1 domain-containing protein n=1 Tax=Duganella radicis TaxID=551988 RepID=A0A6L6PCG1_9BURK|nr:avidin/streptavidin family protein [Duganella radicis]MTV36329.1 hypothetical protein [Duganella radicis]
MNYIDIKGKWTNNFGSVMDITEVDPDSGIFGGTYASSTGANGRYRVTGLTDTRPDQQPGNDNSQTVAFAVSWRDLDGGPKDANWVSAFAGQLQIIEGQLVMNTTYLLQSNTMPADDWGATAVAVTAFTRTPQVPADMRAPHVVFALTRGALSNNGATPWTARTGIGTPAQTLRFMLDSGTQNTWVTSIQCTSNACLAHQRFNPRNSGTYREIDAQPKEVNFGPWGKMTVLMGADNFTLKHFDGEQYRTGLTVEPMNFEAAIHYTGCAFQQLDCDGGIAIPSPYRSASQAEALMLQLIKDKKIAYPVAAFWCDPHDRVGECVFGAVDPDKYQRATLQWLALQNPGDSGLGYLWSVALQAFKVDGKAVQAGITQFALDTGSSYFKGPAALIDTLRNAVTNNGRLPTYVASAQALADYPVISLSLGQQTYDLHPDQYFLKLNDEYWELGIEVLDGMPDGMLLVGSMFLETLYCIFDYAGMQVGLARR